MSPQQMHMSMNELNGVYQHTTRQQLNGVYQHTTKQQQLRTSTIVSNTYDTLPNWTIQLSNINVNSNLTWIIIFMRTYIISSYSSSYIIFTI